MRDPEVHTHVMQIKNFCNTLPNLLKTVAEKILDDDFEQT